MSKTAQEGVFILLKVIKRHKEKRREGRKDLPKLKTKVMSTISRNFCELA